MAVVAFLFGSLAAQFCFSVLLPSLLVLLLSVVPLVLLSSSANRSIASLAGRRGCRWSRLNDAREHNALVRAIAKCDAPRR